MEIFQEFDHRDMILLKDLDNVIAYRKFVEKLWAHIFINGLYAEFDQIQWWYVELSIKQIDTLIKMGHQDFRITVMRLELQQVLFYSRVFNSGEEHN